MFAGCVASTSAFAVSAASSSDPPKKPRRRFSAWPKAGAHLERLGHRRPPPTTDGVELLDHRRIVVAGPRRRTSGAPSAAAGQAPSSGPRSIITDIAFTASWPARPAPAPSSTACTHVATATAQIRDHLDLHEYHSRQPPPATCRNDHAEDVARRCRRSGSNSARSPHRRARRLAWSRGARLAACVQRLSVSGSPRCARARPPAALPGPWPLPGRVGGSTSSGMFGELHRDRPAPGAAGTARVSFSQARRSQPLTAPPSASRAVTRPRRQFQVASHHRHVEREAPVAQAEATGCHSTRPWW